MGFFKWIDRMGQGIAQRLFVRFEYDFSIDQLRSQLSKGKVVFSLPYGGPVEWMMLSAWCRANGLGSIAVVNRRWILLFSSPRLYFRFLFGRTSFAELFAGNVPGPRLFFCPPSERKRIYSPTGTEKQLRSLIDKDPDKNIFHFTPVVIRWRRYARGSRKLSEYLFGTSSRPNTIGKLWFLAVNRSDSGVRGLETFNFGDLELPSPAIPNESDGMRLAKSVRRKILVLYNQEMRVVLGPRYQSPFAVKETLIREPEIQEMIEATAKERNVDRRKVMAEAYRNLTELVAIYRYRFIEVLYVILDWLFTRVFDGMDLDERELQSVRETMKTKPIVFVPCHRSHLDYLVIPYVLFKNEMITPHIAAGINLAFWPVGGLLRRGGAFFIRRSFRGDRLYALTVKKYVEYLLKNRFNIKFFIEGTRSRSGKMLAPAYGILKMVLETQNRKVCDDIALIPVSICYDEVPEQGSYSKELGGSAKVKESASQLLRSSKIAQRKFGKVYVRFADPVYTRDVVSGTNEEEFTRSLQKTAFQVCKSINDATPVTPKSIVAAVLLCHRIPNVALEEIIRLSLMVAEYVEVSGFSLSIRRGQGLRRAVEQTVRALQKQGILNVYSSVPRTYFCENRKRIILNYYKNNGIHCFAAPSIALVSLLTAASVRNEKEIVVSADDFDFRARELRNLLKFEFFFSPTRFYLEELRKNLSFFFGDFPYKEQEWKLDMEHLRVRVAEWNDLSVYLRMIGELLESYRTTLLFIKKQEKSMERKAFAQKVLKFGESRSLQGEITYPESLSLQNVSNAIKFFEYQSLLTLERKGEKVLVSRSSTSGDKIEEKFDFYLSFLEQELESMFVANAGVKFGAAD